MSEREVLRAAVLAQVAAEEWTLVEAAERMELSYRQAKRQWKRYQSQGATGLVHGNAGRSSNRAQPKKVRRQVVRLIRQKYSGEVGERFGPTLAAEHLESEDSIKLSATTVRRWMLAEGLWSRERKVRVHRQRRERRSHFGELVQLDGSFHEWLEKRGPRGCLIGTHAASGLRSSVNQIDASSFPTTAADESAIEHPKEGDARLLGNQHAVNFRAAELYLGITPRGRQKAIKAGKLAVVGERGRRRITVESLKRYLPPCRCAICCPQDNAN